MFTASSSSRKTTPSLLSRRRASSSISGATSTARATAQTRSQCCPIVHCFSLAFEAAFPLRLRRTFERCSTGRGLLVSYIPLARAGLSRSLPLVCRAPGRLAVFRHVQSHQGDHHLTLGPDRPPREAGRAQFTSSRLNAHLTFGHAVLSRPHAVQTDQQ